MEKNYFLRNKRTNEIECIGQKVEGTYFVFAKKGNPNSRKEYEWLNLIRAVELYDVLDEKNNVVDPRKIENIILYENPEEKEPINRFVHISYLYKANDYIKEYKNKKKTGKAICTNDIEITNFETGEKELIAEKSKKYKYFFNFITDICILESNNNFYNIDAAIFCKSFFIIEKSKMYFSLPGFVCTCKKNLYLKSQTNFIKLFVSKNEECLYEELFDKNIIIIHSKKEDVKMCPEVFNNFFIKKNKFDKL